jgi:hypothetical protein
MLYFIRCAFAFASRSSALYFEGKETSDQAPAAEGLQLLEETRNVFRKLSQESPKAKVERWFLLGSLEIARECRSRRWEEREPCFANSSRSPAFD